MESMRVFLFFRYPLAEIVYGRYFFVRHAGKATLPRVL